eukprot:scaffold54060_cov32-Cyclotella_meneghiniana.AAC.9
MNAHIQQVRNVRQGGIQVGSTHNVWNNRAPVVLTNHPTPPPLQQQQHLGRVQQTPSQGKHARHKTEWCKHIIQGK